MKPTFDPIWEKIHSTQAWGQYPSEPLIRFVARNYYSKEKSRVRILDFGCGQGASTWYLAREGFDTYAFDGSESAVRKAKERLDKEGLHATFQVVDAAAVDYSDEFFDAVIDNACIYANRLEDIRKMYQNVYRILKKGGKLYSSCFGEELYGYATGTEIEKGTYTGIQEGPLKNRGVTHIFSKAELEEMLHSTGFRNVMVDWNKYTDHGNPVHLLIAVAEK